jgi:hypothetical protein
VHFVSERGKSREIEKQNRGFESMFAFSLHLVFVETLTCLSSQLALLYHFQQKWAGLVE